MTMNDPRSPNPRSRDASARSGDVTPWIIGAIAVVILVALAVWAMNRTNNTASTNPPAQTTGQNSGPSTPAKK